MQTRLRSAAPRVWAIVAVTLVAGSVTFAGSAALATHIRDWAHDHSNDGVPPRPSGYTEMVRTFGEPCSDRANNARSFWPNQDYRNEAGYVYYHSYLARNIGYNIRNHVEVAHKNDSTYYLIGGYNCRYIAGTTSWSTHAFGAAIDTNTARNPLGQDHWNGVGADGENYRKYLPDVYRGSYPGHKFFWGINWSRPDPMHFQYVTDY